jgi:hypothetical protein
MRLSSFLDCAGMESLAGAGRCGICRSSASSLKLFVCDRNMDTPVYRSEARPCRRSENSEALGAAEGVSLRGIFAIT